MAPKDSGQPAQKPNKHRLLQHLSAPDQLLQKPDLWQLGLFGLAVSVVGGAFWLGTGWLSQRVLGQADLSPTPIFLADPQQVELVLRLTVVSIDAEIDRRGNTSEVTVQVRGSTLQELEFEYPLIDYADLERAIAQELNLPPSSIRQLIRYRLD
ncbi:MAG: hypothetical protein D6742_08235 [Cyanobacteria bacterium J069]|nr:MAG: hypothetical protein D6742_08235 [Cyanobacteria bacterium J069]